MIETSSPKLQLYWQNPFLKKMVYTLGIPELKQLYDEIGKNKAEKLPKPVKELVDFIEFYLFYRSDIPVPVFIQLIIIKNFAASWYQKHALAMERLQLQERLLADQKLVNQIRKMCGEEPSVVNLCDLIIKAISLYDSKDDNTYGELLHRYIANLNKRFLQEAQGDFVKYCEDQKNNWERGNPVEELIDDLKKPFPYKDQIEIFKLVQELLPPLTEAFSKVGFLLDKERVIKKNINREFSRGLGELSILAKLLTFLQPKFAEFHEKFCQLLFFVKDSEISDAVIEKEINWLSSAYFMQKIILPPGAAELVLALIRKSQLTLLHISDDTRLLSETRYFPYSTRIQAQDIPDTLLESRFVESKEMNSFKVIYLLLLHNMFQVKIPEEKYNKAAITTGFKLIQDKPLYCSLVTLFGVFSVYFVYETFRLAVSGIYIEQMTNWEERKLLSDSLLASVKIWLNLLVTYFFVLLPMAFLIIDKLLPLAKNIYTFSLEELISRDSALQDLLMLRSNKIAIRAIEEQIIQAHAPCPQETQTPLLSAS